MAKIEKQQALERLDAIVAATDAIMVARGDLGVEIPIERVPATQKRIIRAANRAGRPVITATQMLMSMVSSPLPTRAEVTDVANAVLDGTDAVMLSEETAVGHDPAGAVNMMIRLLVETEPLLPVHEGPARSEMTNALAHAAANLADDLDAAAIIVPTQHGRQCPVSGRLPPAPSDPGLQPRSRDDPPPPPGLGRAGDRARRAGGEGSAAGHAGGGAPRPAARRARGRAGHRAGRRGRRPVAGQRHHVLMNRGRELK